MTNNQDQEIKQKVLEDFIERKEVIKRLLRHRGYGSHTKMLERDALKREIFLIDYMLKKVSVLIEALAKSKKKVKP